MPFITFAWTTPALLAGAKTVVRQPWSEKKAKQFHAGTLATAYDRAPYLGGRPVAVIRLTQDPIRQPLTEMTDGDYETEGWHWLYEHRDQLPGWIRASDFSREAFDAWRARAGAVWVLRFEVVAITSTGDQAAEAIAGGMAVTPVMSTVRAA